MAETTANIDIDIREDYIFALAPELLSTLLKDRTLSTEQEPVNIFWATDTYAGRGEGFQYSDQITVPCITGENGNVIVPRVVKSREQQQQRSRAMAEVFTPSWICNKQNNLIDSAWFGRENVFNTEIDREPGENVFPNSVKIYGVKGIKGDARRTEGYITRSTVSKNNNAIDAFKLFFTTSYSTNAINPPKAIVGNPGEVCTETFLLIGPFNNRIDQMNCNKFFDTTFSKFCFSSEEVQCKYQEMCSDSFLCRTSRRGAT